MLLLQFFCCLRSFAKEIQKLLPRFGVKQFYHQPESEHESDAHNRYLHRLDEFKEDIEEF